MAELAIRARLARIAAQEQQIRALTLVYQASLLHQHAHQLLGQGFARLDEGAMLSLARSSAGYSVGLQLDATERKP